MIYSCSMFFNEFRLLDLKIAEQIDRVDQIIIVEAEKTFSNKDKKVLLYGNCQYKHKKLKTILVKADEFGNNANTNVIRQRDVILRDIDIKDDDIIISSDLDEIISAKDFQEVINQIKKFGFVKLGMALYYYKINMLVSGSCSATIGVTGKYYNNSGMTLHQLINNKESKIIPFGKHFSYLSSPENIKLKLESFSHHKAWGKTSMKRISNSVNKGRNLFRDRKKLKIVPIDESYPDTILNNLDDWAEWIA